MKEILSVIFNNMDSYEDFSLVMPKAYNIPFSKERKEVTNIPGRDGSVTVKDGFEDNVIPVTFNFKDKFSIHSKKRLLMSWLLNVDNNQLIFSDDREYYYKVKYADFDVSELERAMSNMGKFTVNFVCHPFSYSVEGSNKITLSKPSLIYNQESYFSKPYLIVYGSGKSSLTINDTTVELNINGYIELDIELEYCHKNGEPMGEHCEGYLPDLIFNTGKNIISWTEGIQKIELIPNWRCL